MKRERDKEALAKYWEEQKARGTLRESLGEPIKRGRGRPRSPQPLRRITTRVDEATLFRIKLVARERRVPWQRMIRAWLSDQAAANLRDLRGREIERETPVAPVSASFPHGCRTSEERRNEAERFTATINRATIRALMVPSREAA